MILPSNGRVYFLCSRSANDFSLRVSVFDPQTMFFCDCEDILEKLVECYYTRTIFKN